MLKLNRTTEYGLIALSYIRGKNAGELASAREIAARFNLPFEILAKTLQRLKEQGVIASTYGTNGGYVLSRDLKTLNLAEFLNMMEGPVAVVSCRNTSGCDYMAQCDIKGTMAALNSRFYDFLNRISLEELTCPSATSTGKTAAKGAEPPVAFVGGEP